MAAALAGLAVWATVSPWLGAGAIAFLTGLWITSTHVPLIPDAPDGVTPWAPALLHLSGGPPIAVLGLWMLVRSQRAERTPGTQRGA